MDALADGFIVRVRDDNGRSVWDALVHDNGMCVQVLDHMARNMSARYPRLQGAYTEAVYPVTAGSVDVGSVAIGYYGPFFINDQELAFITTLNRLLIAAGAVSLILAAGIGLLMARRISLPVARAVAATRHIAEGGGLEAIPERTGIRELDAMAAAVNHLSRTLSEQEALRRRLSADMAHEIRTPLAALQSHVEALMDGVWKPEPARLVALHEEILRANRLVADMEKLARVEGDLAGIARRPTPLMPLLASITTSQEPRFREKGVELAFRPAGTIEITAEVDADRLTQAISNLLSNAREFTPPGGRVEVGLDATARVALITVADTGIGIESHHLPRIFERFYRVDPSRSRATGGAGIGLSIARAIVQAHGGAITVASEPGRGSRFVISIPLSSQGLHNSGVL
jgi:signal transduction histidine kinase